MNINSYFYTMDILTFLINSTTGTRPLLSTLVSLDQDNYQILMLVITLTNYTRILQEMHLLYILEVVLLTSLRRHRALNSIRAAHYERKPYSPL